MEINYKNTLKNYAVENHKKYLIREYSSKNEKKTHEITFGSEKVCLWNCPKCNSEYPMMVVKRTTRNYNCPYCAGRRVNHTNCLWTTHPEIAKLLVNSDIGYKISAGMSKKEKFRCLDCGCSQEKSIQKVVNNGLSCSKCSDGLSYPEKFIVNLLDQLDIKYEKEITFEWSKQFYNKKTSSFTNKRYDFYIASLNMIIETHGRQHYDGCFQKLGGRSLKEEIENDKMKEDLAKANGIKNYIVIDCSLSELNYIKNSTINSELIRHVDLSKIDWVKCHEYACSSIVKTISSMWEQCYDKNDIMDIFKLSSASISKYLKQGTDLGWCNYNPTEEMRKGTCSMANKNHKRIIQLCKNKLVIQEWDSLKMASSQLNIHISSISNAIRGKSKSAGGFKWMYLEDYEQYIKQAN